MTFSPIRHELAALRRLGVGVWQVHFVVHGYDEKFILFLRGDLSEKFAVLTAQLQLAKALKVSPRFVYFDKIEMETP